MNSFIKYLGLAFGILGSFSLNLTADTLSSNAASSSAHSVFTYKDSWTCDDTTSKREITEKTDCGDCIYDQIYVKSASFDGICHSRNHSGLPKGDELNFCRMCEAGKGWKKLAASPRPTFGKVFGPHDQSCKDSHFEGYVTNKTNCLDYYDDRAFSISIGNVCFDLPNQLGTSKYRDACFIIQSRFKGRAQLYTLSSDCKEYANDDWIIQLDEKTRCEKLSLASWPVASIQINGACFTTSSNLYTKGPSVKDACELVKKSGL